MEESGWKKLRQALIKQGDSNYDLLYAKQNIEQIEMSADRLKRDEIKKVEAAKGLRDLVRKLTMETSKVKSCQTDLSVWNDNSKNAYKLRDNNPDDEESLEDRPYPKLLDDDDNSEARERELEQKREDRFQDLIQKGGIKL